MFNRIRKKLNSRRGASITFGLFIFVVCAVLGAVALTAGTASAGRAAKMAEMDQRYHAVNSAAELIAKELCGQNRAVTIVRERVVETTTVKTVVLDETGQQEGEPTTVNSAKATFTTKINNHPIALERTVENYGANTAADDGSSLDTNLSLLTRQAAEQLFGAVKPNCDDGMACSMKNSTAGTRKELSMSLSEHSELQVDIIMERLANGDLKFTISNHIDDSQSTNNDKYTLILLLEASISESEDTRSATPDKTTDSTTDSETNKTTMTDTKVTTVTTTKTSTISWSVKSVKKG